jgi:hypothetical protein
MHRKNKIAMFYDTGLLLAPSMEPILNPEMKIIYIPMNSQSDHTILLCKFPVSLLIWRILVGEISKVGWLIRFDKNVIGTNSLYFLLSARIWILPGLS